LESLFEHQESLDFLVLSYSLLMNESDRGSVLIGVSMLDEQLTKLFEAILPENTSKKRKKEIFDSRGAFGNLSSKLDIAYVCQLLPADLINSIHRLRKLRNDLAHQIAPFTIEENLEAIYEVFSLTRGNLAAGMLHLSEEFVYSYLLEKLLTAEHPTVQGKKLFDSKDDAILFLSEDKNIKKKLSEKRIKVMFVIGVSSLAALIIYHRDKIIAKHVSEAQVPL
jgi:hypothetical protein